MTDYAVGDIHGCYTMLRRLLDRAGFSPSRDRLWVVGDIINRGPDSLQSLRYVANLGHSATVVLGNHDMHYLAVALGGHRTRGKDTLTAILQAPDRDWLTHWLCRQEMCVYDRPRNLVMVHAGLPHIWSASEAESYGKELCEVIRGPNASEFFRHMYGNEPSRWDPELQGVERWRVITNYFARMRFIAADGTLELATKESAGAAPDGFAPWFSHPRADDVRVLFGHWAALQGQTGNPQFIGLDTGCVWGGELTLMNLDSGETLGCDCA